MGIKRLHAEFVLIRDIENLITTKNLCFSPQIKYPLAISARMGCCCSSPKAAEKSESPVVEQFCKTAISKDGPTHSSPTPTSPPVATEPERQPNPEEPSPTLRCWRDRVVQRNHLTFPDHSGMRHTQGPERKYRAVEPFFETILLRADFNNDYLDLKGEEQYRDYKERNRRLTIALECGLKKIEEVDKGDGDNERRHSSPHICWRHYSEHTSGNSSAGWSSLARCFDLIEVHFQRSTTVD